MFIIIINIMQTLSLYQYFYIKMLFLLSQVSSYGIDSIYRECQQSYPNMHTFKFHYFIASLIHLLCNSIAFLFIYQFNCLYLNAFFCTSIYRKTFFGFAQIFEIHLFLLGLIYFDFHIFHIIDLYGSRIWVSNPYELTGKI